MNIVELHAIEKAVAIGVCVQGIRSEEQLDRVEDSIEIGIDAPRYRRPRCCLLHFRRST